MESLQRWRHCVNGKENYSLYFHTACISDREDHGSSPEAAKVLRAAGNRVTGSVYTVGGSVTPWL